MKSVRPFVLAGVLVIAAVYAHLLTQLHGALNTAGYDAAAGCGLGGWFDCSKSLASGYSTLLGLPVSAYAMAWFLFMLGVLAIGAARRVGSRALFRSLLLAAAPAAAAVLVFAFLSIAVLRVLCVYCLGVYAIVALIALLAARGAELDWASLRRQARVVAWWGVPVVMFGMAIAFARWSTNTETDASAAASSSVASVPRLGPRTAPLKLVLFTAFECPACRTGAKELERFRSAHLDDVELQVVTIPLHGFPALLKDEPVPVANYLPAALGLVLHQRGRFWEFYREVFHSERKVDEPFLWDVVARIVGPREIPAIARELENPAIIATLRRNAAITRSNGVTNTPTYVINGKREIGPLKANTLESRLSAVRDLSQPGRLTQAATGSRTVRVP